MTSPAGEPPDVEPTLDAASGPSAAGRGASWFRSGQDESAMELDASDMRKVVNRLKRAQGQLAGVVRMLDEGQGCEDIVTQLSAVSSALDRAGFAIVAAGLRQCLIESDGTEALQVKKLEKIFLALA